MQVSCTINGTSRTANVTPIMTLLQALRDVWGLTGSKEGCAAGECGACTVLLDGEAVDSCLILVGEIEGRSITTIEGLIAADGTQDPLQDAFVEHGASQCGYCIPGFIVAARALLNKNPHATGDEIRVGVSGNLCRCTGYTKIFAAIEAVVQSASSS